MFPIRDTTPARSTPVVTFALIFLNVAVFLFQFRLPEAQIASLFQHYGVVPARFTNGAWAAAAGLGFSFVPLVTTQFLHGGLLHLVGNMWMLWIFGDNVEDRLGRGRFLAFYLLCGVAAALLHIASGPSSTVPAVGASGAIAGVLGAYFLLYPNARVLTLIPIIFFFTFVELPAVVFIGLWFLVQLFSGALSLIAGTATGVAWWAHIGGFLAGMLLLRWLSVRRPPPRRVIHPWGPDGPAVIEVEPRSPQERSRP